MKNGFTLVEIIIAIVIMGILVTLAVPRLSAQRDGAAAGEAVNALSALHGAQLRYCMDHDDCTAANSYPTCDSLDVVIPALKNFNAPTCSIATGAISAAHTTAGYTISVSATGVYTCPSCTAYVLKILPK